QFSSPSQKPEPFRSNLPARPRQWTSNGTAQGAEASANGPAAPIRTQSQGIHLVSSTPRRRADAASAMSSGSRSDGRSIGTSVGDGENLPEMSVAVFPVDVLAAEATVDQHVVLSARVAPVREARGLDAAEDRVEVGLADAEAEVVTLELLAVGEVESQRLVDVDRRELAP